MTKEDFNRWYEDYCAAFPETVKWMATVENQQATMGKWFQALQSIDANDAMAATDQIVTGKAEPIEGFERERTPYIIALRAKAIRNKRFHFKTHDAEQQRARALTNRERDVADRLGFDEPMRACLAEVNQAKAEGRDHSPILDKYFPVDEQQSPRYRCLQCRDSGRVLIWNGPKPPNSGRCVVACDCESGHAFVRTEENPNGLALYNPNRMCLLTDDYETWRVGALQRMRESMPNYSQELAEWSANR